jgi:hypothetical protein
MQHAPLGLLHQALPYAAEAYRPVAGAGEHDLGLYVGSTVAAPDMEEEGFTM